MHNKNGGIKRLYQAFIYSWQGLKYAFAKEAAFRPAENRSDLRVILYNKPEGEICSRNDPEGRPTVYDRLPSLNAGRWISVGRLDFNTSGLLLFTNNGELANKLMHPSTGIDREYLVRVQGEVSNEQLQALRDGVELEDGQAKFSDITLGGGKGTNCWYYCTVMEGRNREVRRLWESQGCRVSRLKRVRYGQIIIPSYVRVGQWIELAEGELAMLCETAGVRAPAKKKFQRGEMEQYERRIKRLRSSPGKPQARTSRTGKTAAERAATLDRPWLEPKPAKNPAGHKPASQRAGPAEFAPAPGVKTLSGKRGSPSPRSENSDLKPRRVAVASAETGGNRPSKFKAENRIVEAKTEYRGKAEGRVKPEANAKNAPKFKSATKSTRGGEGKPEGRFSRDLEHKPARRGLSHPEFNTGVPVKNKPKFKANTGVNPKTGSNSGRSASGAKPDGRKSRGARLPRDED